jgi:hypothetical protein
LPEEGPQERSAVSDKDLIAMFEKPDTSLSKSKKKKGGAKKK